jgi:hypothetical protein
MTTIATLEEAQRIVASVRKGHPVHPRYLRAALVLYVAECEQLQRDLQDVGEIALKRGDSLERVVAAVRDCAHTLTEESQRLLVAVTS